MKNILIFLLLLTAAAGAEEWKLERNRDGIKVYTRRVEGISFKEYKGVIRLDASLSTIIAVFDDYKAATEWIDTCSSMELVERISPMENYTYSYNPAPWPVKDRDAVVHSRTSQDPETLIVTVKQNAAPDKKARTRKAVRVEFIQSLWTLTPQQDGSTELIYQALSDPGGGLPAWLVNSVAISQPFNTLAGLREMVKLEKYRTAKVSHIKNKE